MDDRELSTRLTFIEEKVTAIEEIIQQYWTDLIKEKEGMTKETEEKKRSVIKLKSEESR